MPTGFERAKLVIDALMPIAEQLVQEGSVDAVIQKRLNSLSQAYGGRLLVANRQPVDYTKITTHIAYTYRCLGAHSDWVFKALSLAGTAVVEQIGRSPIKVCSIGGGPGSDIAGVMKFAGTWNLANTAFNFDVLDRETAWNRARSELTATFRPQFTISERHIALDLAAGPEWVMQWDFSDADIFTMSFALSELWSFDSNGSVSKFFDRLISDSKCGAIFCYVDNGGDNFTPRAEELFYRDDVEILGSNEDDRLLLSNDEQCSVIEIPFRHRFGQRPKLTGNVAMRVWRKI
jgi:hypothetical protein